MWCGELSDVVIQVVGDLLKILTSHRSDDPKAMDRMADLSEAGDPAEDIDQKQLVDQERHEVNASEPKPSLVAGTKHVLMVLTSNGKLGDKGEQTGCYLPEVAHSYDEFIAAGCNVTFASPQGGAVSVDTASVDMFKDNASCMAFIDEGSPTKALVDNTVALGDIQDTSVYDAVFFAGGVGTMCDIPGNLDVQRITRSMWKDDKVVGGVCHGPSALVNATPSDRTALVSGNEATIFANNTEHAVKDEEMVPFKCQDALTEKGAAYTQGGTFQPHIVDSGKLITGQNPVSTARAVVARLRANVDVKKIKVTESKDVAAAKPVHPSTHVICNNKGDASIKPVEQDQVCVGVSGTRFLVCLLCM